MSNQIPNEARWLAKKLADLEKLQKASHIAPRLAHSSVEEGGLKVTDSDGNVVDVLGPKPQEGQIIIPGREPSKPSTPVVTAYLGTATTVWDGTYTEEYVAPDLKHLEVHASTDDEFEPTSATVIGTITNRSGGSSTAALDYGTWFFRLIAVSTSEARSEPSDIASAEVIPLVEAPDMQEVLADIDARYDGVITEAGQLGERLEQALSDLQEHETRLASTEADLNLLETETLVQLKEDLQSAKTDLDKAVADISTALVSLDITKTDLETLKSITLPALESALGAAENRLSATETDVTSALKRLGEAEAELASVTAQAGTALTMAGSKTTVFYNSAAPVGSAHPNPDLAKQGDLWRRIDASKNVIAEWYWTGSAWQASQITNGVISNLDVGKLTAGSAIIQTAVINKIAAQTADVIELNADRITAGTISSARIDVSDLAAKIATVIQLNADRITAGTIATGRLNATEVAAAVASVIQLNADRITAGTINTARLNTNEIAAKVATVIELNADRITSGVINTDRLNVNEIAARSAAFQTVDVKNLFVTTGTMSEAVINKLWSDVVHSKKITTEMLAIGDFTNQIATGLGMNNEAIDWAEGLTPDFVDVPVGISHSFKSAVGQGTFATKSNFFDVNPGDEFVFEVWIKADKPGSRFFFELRDQNGAHGVTSTRLTAGDSFYGNASYPISSAPVPTTWTRWRAKCIPKEGVRSLRIASLYFNHPNGTERNAQIWLAGVSFRKRFGGELIVDGTVTAEKIAANAVEADKLAANSVTADKIEAGAVKAQHVGAKEISAEKLRIGEGTNIFTDTLMKDTEGWGIHPSLSPAPDGYGPSNRVRVTAGSGQTGGYYGYKDTMTDRRSKVIPGRTYKISVWVRPTVNISASNVIAVYTRLYNESGGYTTGYEWTTPSNFTNSVETTGLSTIPAGQWVKMESQFIVPSDKEKVFLTPGFFLNSGFPTGSSCDFSNLVISEMTSGELIVDGAIDGKTITGALIQTHNEPEKGIKISNEGILAYDSEGSQTMQITPGSGVDYMGFFGKPIHRDQYMTNDGWMFSSVSGENYVFFRPRIDGDPFSIGTNVRFTFDAYYSVDPDNATTTSLPVTANVWGYPQNTWGDTLGNKRNISSTFTIDTTPRTYDVTVNITQLPTPFMSWIAGLQPADGSAYDATVIQDRVGIRNIKAYIDGEEIDLNPRQQLAGIDQAGEVSGQNLNMAGTSRLEGPVIMNGDPIDGHGSGEHGPVILGRDLLGATYVDFFESHPSSGGSAWLTPMPHGLLSNSYENGWNGSNDNKWTMSGKPGGIQNMVHIQDTVEIKNGRGYLITYTAPAFKATDGNAGSPGASVVTYTTGRTIGIGTGKALHGSRYYFSGGPDLDNPGRTVYAVGGQDLPVGDVTLGVEVYVYDNRTIESTGTGDARYWSLNVLDVGAAIKGNTGNSSRITRTRPVDTTKPPVDTPPPPPKPPAKKTYTNTWNASWWGTWWVGNGNGRNSGLDKDGKVAQGKPPGVGYRQRGAVGFPSMTSTLSGSTIKKVEVYVYAAHWYSSAGGTLQIGTHGHTSKPGTWSGGTTGVKNQKLAKPEGRWITLPTSVHAGVKSGSVRGVQVYTSSTGSSYYGYLTGSKTKIRVTYEK